MQERHVNRESYFDEQARTTKKHYISYMRKHTRTIPNKILEVGCGDKEVNEPNLAIRSISTLYFQ